MQNPYKFDWNGHQYEIHVSKITAGLYQYKAVVYEDGVDVSEHFDPIAHNPRYQAQNGCVGVGLIIEGIREWVKNGGLNR